MKIITTALLACMAGTILLQSCASQKEVESTQSIASRMNTKLTANDKKWNVHLQTINFVDKDPQSQGSKIYHALIPQPDPYIRSVAREVMRTLYYKPTDSIPMCRRLDYILKDDQGISAKGGGNGFINRS